MFSLTPGGQAGNRAAAEQIKGWMTQLVPGAAQSTLMVRNPCLQRAAAASPPRPAPLLVTADKLSETFADRPRASVALSKVTEVACVGENCPPLSTAMVMMTSAGNNMKRILHCRMVDVTVEQVSARRSAFLLQGMAAQGSSGFSQRASPGVLLRDGFPMAGTTHMEPAGMRRVA